MLAKQVLLTKVLSVLKANEYKAFVTEGCFDVAAKKRIILLIKTLVNIDGLLQTHALSLRAISYFLSAHPFVIGLVTNRTRLADDLVYFRFKLPVVTPRMLDKILAQEAFDKKALKGKHLVEIDTNVLRESRVKLSYSLRKLARSVGISKKALYEIEKQRVRPTEETVRKLEEVLKVKLAKPFRMFRVERGYIEPANATERRVSSKLKELGIDNTSVCSTKFDLVGKRSFPLIAKVAKTKEELIKSESFMKEVSRFFCSCSFFISKQSGEMEVPVLTIEELLAMESFEEFRKRVGYQASQRKI